MSIKCRKCGLTMRRSHESQQHCFDCKDEMEIQSLRKKLNIAKEALMRIAGQCIHAESVNADFCDCSTRMMLDAEKAIVQIQERFSDG